MTKEDNQNKVYKWKNHFTDALPLIFDVTLAFLFSTAAYFLANLFPVISLYLSPTIFTGLSAYVGFFIGRALFSVVKRFVGRKHKEKPLSERSISKAYAILGCIVGATISAFFIPGVLADILGPVIGIFVFHQIAKGILERRLYIEKEETKTPPNLMTIVGIVGVVIGAAIGWFYFPGLLTTVAMVVCGAIGVVVGYLGNKLKLAERVMQLHPVQSILDYFRERKISKIVFEAIAGTGFLVGNAVGVVIALLVAPSSLMFTVITLASGVTGYLLSGVAGFFASEKIKGVDPHKKAVGATATTAGALVGLSTGAFLGSFFPLVGTAIGAAVGAFVGMGLGGAIGMFMASSQKHKYKLNMGTAIGGVAGANIGIMLGGIIGTFVLPVFGSALGAMLGSIAGLAAGVFGTALLFRYEKTEPDGGGKQVNQGYMLLADELNVELNQKEKEEKKEKSLATVHAPVLSPHSSAIICEKAQAASSAELQPASSCALMTP